MTELRRKQSAKIEATDTEDETTNCAGGAEQWTHTLPWLSQVEKV